MPDLEDSGTSESQAPSRRSMLKGTAAAGAAGLAATTIAGMAAPASAAIRTRHTPAAAGQEHEHASHDAIVVHVRNAATGELDIFHGTSETRVQDRALAARIIRAAR
jgi:hypothetical protein